MREKTQKHMKNMHQNTSSNIKIKTEGENTKTHEKIENKQTEGENTKTHKTHETSSQAPRCAS